MKYDVMIEVKEEILEIVQGRDIPHWSSFGSGLNTININKLTPSQCFMQVIDSRKGYEDKNFGLITFYSPIQIFTNKKIYHKEWVYFKTINIDGGELRKNDCYEIDGIKNKFEIVYNDKTDKVELRVNYTKEIVKHPSYEKVEQWYDEFKKLLDDYEKEELLKKEIKKEIQEEMGKAEGEKLMNEAKKFVKRQKENAGFFKKLFRR